MFIQHLLSVFYGHFNAYMAGITLFSFISSKEYLLSIQIVAKDIAILRLSVISGGHLAFSHAIVNEKMETVFFSVHLGQLKWKKTQLFEMYTKKSQDIYLLHNCVYYVHFMLILTHL